MGKVVTIKWAVVKVVTKRPQVEIVSPAPPPDSGVEPVTLTQVLFAPRENEAYTSVCAVLPERVDTATAMTVPSAAAASLVTLVVPKDVTTIGVPQLIGSGI